MKKKNGFTLIELLAMLVVLGVLIGITIPNITGILGTQRINAFKADANSLVERAKIKVEKDPLVDKPKTDECLVLTMDYLNDNDDFGSAPYGGLYHSWDSFVIYTKKEVSTGVYKYKYYVRLVEEFDGKYYSLDVKKDDAHLSLVDVDDINDLKVSNYVVIEDVYGLSRNKIQSVNILNDHSDATRTFIGDTCGFITTTDYHVVNRSAEEPSGGEVPEEDDDTDDGD